MPTTYHCRLKAHSEAKDGTKIDTQLHYDYVAREGKYANIKNHGEDLRFKRNGNLPPWANNKAENFWKEAEADRLKKGYVKDGKSDARAFREFELGLQMNLSLDDNIECVEEFLKRTGIADKNVFSYAIHDRPAKNDEDMLNIHAHIMFDEHILEKDRVLNTPQEFFKRYSKNKNGELVGGYKKDRTYNTKELLLQSRELWADINNAKLKERGWTDPSATKLWRNNRQP